MNVDKLDRIEEVDRVEEVMEFGGELDRLG